MLGEPGAPKPLCDVAKPEYFLFLLYCNSNFDSLTLKFSKLNDMFANDLAVGNINTNTQKNVRKYPHFQKVSSGMLREMLTNN